MQYIVYLSYYTVMLRILNSGSGIILEGTIQSRSHIAVTDISKTKVSLKNLTLFILIDYPMQI